MFEEKTEPPNATKIDWFAPATERERQLQGEKEPSKLPLGPLEVVHVFWLAGMSCDGCSIAAVGATSPPVEQLLTGSIPGVPKVVLHHPVLSVEAGKAFIRNFEMAEAKRARCSLRGRLRRFGRRRKLSPRRAAATWAALGTEEREDGSHRPIPTAEWLGRLAPNAAAVVAIGTCATWGGIPAAAGNPTGSMSVMDYLGGDYRSSYGLPVVNIPGCSPIGDQHHRDRRDDSPVPTRARPAARVRRTRPTGVAVPGHRSPAVRAGRLLRRGHLCGALRRQRMPRRARMLGSGRAVQPLLRVGAINHMGGCMNTGGICIGCTMPGFPDRFAPFYKTPPGSAVSTNTSRMLGTFIRPPSSE